MSNKGFIKISRVTENIIICRTPGSVTFSVPNDPEKVYDLCNRLIVALGLPESHVPSYNIGDCLVDAFRKRESSKITQEMRADAQSRAIVAKRDALRTKSEFLDKNTGIKVTVGTRLRILKPFELGLSSSEWAIGDIARIARPLQVSPNLGSEGDVGWVLPGGCYLLNHEISDPDLIQVLSFA